jgi:acyl-coenzyme A synthetase/AMP-(fatty) acid ligase
MNTNIESHLTENRKFKPRKSFSKHAHISSFERRIDGVLNVAGHRLGTSEIESALVSHAAVAESAVVGRPDEMKGQSVVAFVTLKSGQSPNRAEE